MENSRTRLRRSWSEMQPDRFIEGSSKVEDGRGEDRWQWSHRGRKETSEPLQATVNKP